tara:strand:+ start:1890 stop:2030 length:141 start_codon:yes stop_codon:yes gene_type:complete
MMILEEKVKKILKQDLPRLAKHVPWDGMYDNMARKIVKEVKEEITR